MKTIITKSIIVGMFTMLIIPSPSFGKTKEFVREYIYNASEMDSKITARTMALSQIKGLLFEELGSYIFSSFKMDSEESDLKFKEISTSQIKSISSGITQTKILDETWDGEHFYLKAEIGVDEDELKNRIREIASDEKQMTEIDKLRIEREEAQAKIDKLRNALLEAADEKRKRELRQAYYQASEYYASSKWNHDYWLGQAKPVRQQRAKMEVVFVIDATGSMGGMIANAKNKIWSIATALGQSEPAPELHIGIVAYRDRGDQYITKKYPLTTDIDLIYSQLMGISAAGGGDGPESVNEGLARAVNEFQWDDQEGTYKTIFLIGDAPPHMNYSNEQQYKESCERANRKEILINTIQCGNDYNTARVWEEISRATQGDFMKLDAKGSAIAMSTPYDRKLAEKTRELERTQMYYGTNADKAKAKEKQDRAEDLYETTSEEERARRAVFNTTTAAGKDNMVSDNEILDAIMNGSVDLDDMSIEVMPAAIAAVEEEHREAYVKEKIEERKLLEDEIKALNAERNRYLTKEIETREAEVSGSFNSKIQNSLRTQTRKKNMTMSAMPSF